MINKALEFLAAASLCVMFCVWWGIFYVVSHPRAVIFPSWFLNIHHTV